MPERLTQDELTQRMGTLPGWAVAGEAIEKRFEFADFRGSVAFVNNVAELAEAVNHHPDIMIAYNRVTITLSTHDAGGITQNDVDLARAIEAAPAAST